MQDGYLSISVINASNNRPIQDALVNVYGMNDQQESTGLVSGKKFNFGCSKYWILSSTFRC